MLQANKLCNDLQQSGKPGDKQSPWMGEIKKVFQTNQRLMIQLMHHTASNNYFVAWIEMSLSEIKDWRHLIDCSVNGSIVKCAACILLCWASCKNWLYGFKCTYLLVEVHSVLRGLAPAMLGHLLIRSCPLSEPWQDSSSSASSSFWELLHY